MERESYGEFPGLSNLRDNLRSHWMTLFIYFAGKKMRLLPVPEEFRFI